MYRCSVCKEVFQFPHIAFEQEPGLGMIGYPVCPFCKSDQIDEVDQCIICAKWGVISDMVQGVCAECVTNIMARYSKIMYDEFNADERKVIDEKTIREGDPFYILEGLGGGYDTEEDLRRAHGEEG